MSGTGTLFPGNLDPTAQEFVPSNPIQNRTGIPFFTPPSLYFQYSPPVLHLSPPHPPNDVQLLPFYPPPPPPQYNPGHPVGPYAGVVTVPRLPPPSTVPTRALVLFSVPDDISESVLRRDLELYGEVRGVQMERVLEGIVTVHFYDLRHAETALREIREQHMHHQLRFRSYILGQGELNSPVPFRGLVSGRAVWAQFVIPASNAVPDGNNQGTLVIFNLEPTVSSSYLKGIFHAYGPVKELRETPYKKHQRFVEFFDVRDAAKALREMNGKEIQGKPVVIQFSRPGGFYSKKLFFRSNYNKNPVISNPLALTPPSPPTQKFSGHTLPSSSVSSRHRLYQAQSSFKKSVNCTRESPIASMRSLSLSEGEGKCTEKSQRINQKQLHKSNNSKPSKSKHTKKRDARFVISEDAIADSGSSRDGRTTVMIKNIPNKYSQKLLLNMLDNHCIHCNEQISAQGEDTDQPLSSYDFVYLPIDFNNKCNVGYGFVNVTSPQAAWRLYKAFHLQHWEVFNSRKICEVTYARVQGLEALKEHFKNSKFPCETEQFMPVVFSPPRDGRRLTEPIHIVDRGKSISNSDEHDDDDDHHYHYEIVGEDLSASESCRADHHHEVGL